MRSLRKVLSLALALSLLFQQIGFAQIATELNIASHLSRMASSFAIDKFRPIHLRYFSYDPNSNNFKFLFDKGDLKQLEDAKFKEQSVELLKYFLIGITLPDSKFWVNLRPDSSDQIIEPELEQTDLGKVLLEADLQLKKDTARYTSPETPEGREYWNRLYKKAEELFGYENVTIPTLTRPWIVPGEIIVRETQDSAFIYKSTLKVMLESDYLLSKSRGHFPSGLSGDSQKESVPYTQYEFKDHRSKALNEYSTQLIKELIIPKLTKEVNTSKKYAGLRQVFYSLILARWFKARYKLVGDTFHQGYQGTLSRKVSPTVPVYVNLINSGNLTGLTSKEPWSKTTYFEQYKKSFADGEYNLKEQVSTPTGQVIRSYFSGGIEATAPATTYSGIGAIGEQGFSTLSANKNFAAVTFAKTGPSDGAVLAPIISLQGEIEEGQKQSAGSPVEALKQELITRGLNLELTNKLLKAMANKQFLLLGQNAFYVSDSENQVRLFSLQVSDSSYSGKHYHGISFEGSKGAKLSISVFISSTGKIDHIEIYTIKIDKDGLVSIPDIADNIMKALNSAAGSPVSGNIMKMLPVTGDKIRGELVVPEEVKEGKARIDIRYVGKNVSVESFTFSITGGIAHLYDPSIGMQPFKTDKRKVTYDAKTGKLTVELEYPYEITNKYEAYVVPASSPASERKDASLNDNKDILDKLVTLDSLVKEFEAPTWYESREGNVYDDLVNMIRNARNAVAKCQTMQGLKSILVIFKQDQKRTENSIASLSSGNLSSQSSYAYSDKEKLKTMMMGTLQAIIALIEVKLEANSEQVQGVNAVGSPMRAQENKAPVGGIDFRVMNIITQPLVASSSLSLKLPQSANLTKLNLDEELKQFKNLLAAKIAPSGERFNEVMASSALKGEWNKRIPDIISCLIETCRLEEENVSDTPPEIKEALIMADAANLVG